MYYYSGAQNDLEEWYYDFFKHCKSNNSGDYRIKSNYEMNDRWPYYEYDIEEKQKNTMYDNINNKLDMSNMSKEMRAKSYINRLYSPVNKKLNSIIKELFKEYDYPGSPIYDKYIDRETAHQMIDRAVDKTIKELSLKEGISFKDNSDMWGSYSILKSNIEALILNEILINIMTKN